MFFSHFSPPVFFILLSPAVSAPPHSCLFNRRGQAEAKCWANTEWKIIWRIFKKPFLHWVWSCTTRAKLCVLRIQDNFPRLSVRCTWKQTLKKKMCYIYMHFPDGCIFAIRVVLQSVSFFSPTDLFEVFAEHLGHSIWNFDLPILHRRQNTCKSHHPHKRSVESHETANSCQIQFRVIHL